MRFGKASLAAMLAVSMASTPVLAQTTSSAPIEQVDEDEGAEDSWFVPAAAAIAAIIGILIALDVIGGNDGPPRSP